MPSQSVCLVGADGTGKTTLARRLVTELGQNRTPARYVWFRFPYFVTFVILGVAKVLKLTKYQKADKVTIVEHNFHFQPFKTLYPFALLLDTLLHYVTRFLIPLKLGFVIVCDRWIPDIMVDIIMDTGNPSFEETLIGRLFSNLASRTKLTVLVDASEDTLRMRRPETARDPLAKARHLLYRRLASRYTIGTLCSDGLADVTYLRLVDLLKNSGLNLSSAKKIYSNPKSPWLQLLLRRRAFVVFSNWLFQSTLITVKSELVFRMILELFFAILVFVGLFFFTSIVASLILSLVIAHTVNWLVNGNFWVTQKFFGRVCDLRKMLDYLSKMRAKKLFSRHGILAIAAFGSLSRGQFKESSDLDIRIVRRSGGLEWIKANSFALGARLKAFVRGIPVDILVLDNVNQIYEHISRQEPPVVVYDPQDSLSKIHESPMSLTDIRQRAEVKVVLTCE